MGACDAHEARQWRYMRLVALDELSSAKGTTCSEISNRAKILEAQMTTRHELEAVRVPEGPLHIMRTTGFGATSGLVIIE